MKKITPYLKLLWTWKFAWIPNIYFNLRYLPFKQAIRLPIWINKPHLHEMKGRIIIDAPVKAKIQQSFSGKTFLFQPV